MSTENALAVAVGGVLVAMCAGGIGALWHGPAGGWLCAGLAVGIMLLKAGWDQ